MIVRKFIRIGNYIKISHHTNCTENQFPDMFALDMLNRETELNLKVVN